MLNPRFKALLFDLDGVLIDSMTAHTKAWKEVFKEYGLDISPDEIKLREGEKALKSAESIAAKHNLRLSKEELSALLLKKRSIYAANAPKGLVEGAAEMLRRLKHENFKLALVTGSIFKNLNRVMTQAEKNLFDSIITSDTVASSKPHPEPFLRASSELGVPPEECLVVENAPLGIESAKSAGMKVAAITSTLPKENLKRADWVIDNLQNIWDILL